MRDLTALTELKSDGGILERQFLQLKEHVIKGHLAGTSSLHGMHISLQLRCIGGILEEEHAADVDGKVAEILKNSACVEVGGGSGTFAAPLLLSASSRKSKRPAANSGSAAASQPVNRGVWQRERAVANTLGNKFKAYMKKACNSLVWLYPGGCIDALQPIDAGLGAFIKVEVGKQLDLWIENGDNLER